MVSAARPLVRVVLALGPLALAACVDAGLSGPPDNGLDEPVAAGDDIVGATPPPPVLPSTSGTDPGPDGTPDCERTAAVPSWTGVASIRRRGALGDETVRAAVQWRHASTSACIDKYRAAGAVSLKVDGCGIEPATATVALTDGMLIIDRTTSPPTYRVRGTSRWAAAARCGGDADALIDAGGTWAAGGGVAEVGAAVLSGTVDHQGGIVDWTFTRDGAPPAPPGTACAQAPLDRWRGRAGTTAGAVAEVTWRRYQTDGCVDRYKPDGVVAGPGRTPGCEWDLWSPPSQPIGGDDGLLEIDRSTDPPTFHMLGRSTWSGVRSCFHPDGTITTTIGALGGDWAVYGGAVEGGRVAAGATLGVYTYAWSFAPEP